jgi:hypothetical protein
MKISLETITWKLYMKKAKKLTRVGFEPTPFRTRTLIWRLRPTRPSRHVDRVSHIIIFVQYWMGHLCISPYWFGCPILLFLFNTEWITSAHYRATQSCNNRINVAHITRQSILVHFPISNIMENALYSYNKIIIIPCVIDSTCHTHKKYSRYNIQRQ